MVKIGLEAKVVGHAEAALESRLSRDASFDHKAYMIALKQLTKDIEATLKVAKTDPELGVKIARECVRFTMRAMPDPGQEPGRATALSQCQVLEDCLAKVRKPGVYFEEMKRQFGPNLDPRAFPSGQDAFHSIIKSQRNKISAEAKGLNTQVEQIFCRKRSELLREIEKGYSALRDRALDIEK